MAGADIGLIGLGTMGRNLALNLTDHGFAVAGWDRSADAVAKAVAADGRITGTADPKGLVAALRSPRVVFLMVPAGKPVDEQLETLSPLLQPGDVVIDGGNSHYTDTQARAAAMAARGLHFVGLGVSGGEEGARHGPSLMAGGTEAAWDRIAPMLTAIAAKAGPKGDEPCAGRVGPDAAGHFVKMVHNGIEYAEMQILAEAYDLMRHVGGLGLPAMADIFDRWSDSPLGAYLVEITAEVLRETDAETGKPVVDIILDRAGQKGTGGWTDIAAIELGVPVPTLFAAVAARVLSGLKAERVAAEAAFGPVAAGTAAAADLVGDLAQGVMAARICNYAQGFALMAAGSAEYGWNMRLDAVARLWRGGCIIRARILEDVTEAFEADPTLPNLLLAPGLRDTIRGADAALRRLVALSATTGVPAPGLAATLGYLDGYRRARSPANLIQAERDYFGAHGFERIDRPGQFHQPWRRG